MCEALMSVIDLEQYPLQNDDFRAACKHALDHEGVLVMRGFLKPDAVDSVRLAAEANHHLAYYTANNHNIYLYPPDPDYPASHPRNREVISTKACIYTITKSATSHRCLG